ncbi:MAG TPA: HAMP domain-containing protein, partial [Patescibacteria group bacterium]|nr:HAMP domain-containing protein [Patescibacteria group bacterium]
MRRLTLSTLLIAINVGLAFMALAWVVTAATNRLERLSDEQALARVSLAGTGARERLERSIEEVATAGRLLAERPTLARIIATMKAPETRQPPDRTELATFLERFRATTRLTGCAVYLEGRLIAASGATSAPAAARTATRDAAALGTVPDCKATLRRVVPGTLEIHSACAVTAVPGAVVVTNLSLDAGTTGWIVAGVGIPARLIEREESLHREDDPRYDLRARCYANGAPVAQRLDVAGVYLGEVPLSDDTDRIVGVIETSLDIATITIPMLELVRSLLVVSTLVLGLVTLLSVLVARWLARPIESLTQASARIGGGDLDTPIPRATGAELGTLAAGMEEMRDRLLKLTGELRRRQSDAEAVLTGIAEGVFAVDRERKIRYLNPQAAGLLGVTTAQAIGRFCGDVLNPRGPGDVRPCESHCPIVQARFGGQSRATEHLLVAGGRHRTVVITSSPSEAEPVGGRSGTLTGGRQFQILRDETELESTRRLRDVVLANISHEFKTPLAAQLASIELLRERLADPQNAEPQDIERQNNETDMLVLSLQRGTLRLTQLIDNLLESVRLEAGQRSIRRRPLALDEVMEESVEMTAPLIAHRGQTLTVDLPYPLPAITGDSARLTQVFVNLLANANKFAPQGSSIRVGGSVADDEITVWVEDEGPGVRASRLAPLFERFVRTVELDEEGEPE